MNDNEKMHPDTEKILRLRDSTKCLKKTLRTLEGQITEVPDILLNSMISTLKKEIRIAEDNELKALQNIPEMEYQRPFITDDKDLVAHFEEAELVLQKSCQNLLRESKDERQT